MTLDVFRTANTKEQVNYINSFADGVLTLKQIEEKHLSFTNVSKYVDKNMAKWSKATRKFIFIEQSTETLTLTQEEVKFIKEFYKNATLTDKINNADIGEIISRSIRVDAKTMELFCKFCRKNNIKQVNALTQALLNFININN